MKQRFFFVFGIKLKTAFLFFFGSANFCSALIYF